MENIKFFTSSKKRTTYSAWFIGKNIIYMLELSNLALFLIDAIV